MNFNEIKKAAAELLEHFELMAERIAAKNKGYIVCTGIATQHFNDRGENFCTLNMYVYPNNSYKNPVIHMNPMVGTYSTDESVDREVETLYNELKKNNINY